MPTEQSPVSIKAFDSARHVRADLNFGVVRPDNYLRSYTRKQQIRWPPDTMNSGKRIDSEPAGFHAVILDVISDGGKAESDC